MSASRELVLDLKARMGRDIVGQEEMVERLLIGLLANGNLLVEGLPGLAKTRAVKSLARHLDAALSRIQFTPDLLPADVTGTEVYHATDAGGEFRFDPGPIFANVVLADEINRTTPKTQSALLEAMEERQVTVEGETRELPEPFFVIATQNPVSLAGTYPLPESQLDRFLMRLRLGYPDQRAERELLEMDTERDKVEEIKQCLSAEEVADAYRLAGVPVVFGGLHATVLPGEAAGHADAVASACDAILGNDHDVDVCMSIFHEHVERGAGCAVRSDSNIEPYRCVLIFCLCNNTKLRREET